MTNPYLAVRADFALGRIACTVDPKDGRLKLPRGAIDHSSLDTPGFVPGFARVLQKTGRFRELCDPGPAVRAVSL